MKTAWIEQGIACHRDEVGNIVELAAIPSEDRLRFARWVQAVWKNIANGILVNAKNQMMSKREVAAAVFPHINNCPGWEDLNLVQQQLVVARAIDTGDTYTDIEEAAGPHDYKDYW